MFNLIVFILVKLIKKKKQKINEKINLIDTYIDHRKIDNDILYPSLEKILKKYKSKFFFVPTFIINKGLINLVKNIIICSKKNYIFKESFITLKDFIFILYKSLFKKKLNIKFLYYNHIDYSLLINEEIFSRREFYSEFQSKLNYFFVKKLYLRNTKIKKIVIRFENQSVDKAWVLAFRKFFSKTEIVGYQGYVYYPHLPYQSPTYYESKAKVLPDYIVVTGKIFKKPRLEFYKKMKILIGPSLNNQKIFNTKINRKYDLKFVLALSGIKNLDKVMCEWIFFVLLKNKNLSIVIKPHPTVPLYGIINEIPKQVKSRITISKDNPSSVLEKTEILISSGPTSIILESLIYGCKLIYLNLDPSDVLISKKIPEIKKYVNFINSKQELMNKMIYFDQRRFIKKKNNLTNLFFSKLNKKNIKIFI